MSINFSPTEIGLVRRPPNIETIHLKVEGARVWLHVSRNHVKLSFPLTKLSAAHLAKLLAKASDEADQLVEEIGSPDWSPAPPNAEG